MGLLQGGYYGVNSQAIYYEFGFSLNKFLSEIKSEYHYNRVTFKRRQNNYHYKGVHVIVINFKNAVRFMKI